MVSHAHTSLWWGAPFTYQFAMKGKDYSIIKYASCPSVDKEVDDAFQTRLPSIRHRSNFLTGWRIWRETSFTRNRSRIFNRFKIRPVQCEHSVIVQFHAPKQPHSIGNCNAYKIFKYFMLFIYLFVYFCLDLANPAWRLFWTLKAQR